MADDRSIIKLRRTALNFNQLNNEHLYYGEPLFVKNSEGTFLVLGSTDNNTVAVPDELRLAFVDPSKVNTENSVYFKIVGGVVSLIDQEGQTLNFNPELNLQSLTFNNGTSTKVYNGSNALTITAADVGAISSSDSSVPTPTDSDTQSIANVEYVLAVHTRGYTVVNNIDQSIRTFNCAWNTEYRLGKRSGNLSFNLPAFNTNYSSEIRICFQCTGTFSAFNLTVSNPNTEIVLGTEKLNFQAGNYYEISLACVGTATISNVDKQVISCLVNKIRL